MTSLHLRRFALLALAPCALLLHAAKDAVRQPAAAAQAAPFSVEIKRFERTPITPFDAQKGADTCVVVEVAQRHTPPHVEWFYSRRLVATKGGRARVLWSDRAPDKKIELTGDFGGYSTPDSSINSFIFNLRDVPVEYGEIVFLWDVLAQPTRRNIPQYNETLVGVDYINRQARKGGARLSRRVTLRRAGQKIVKPVFAPRPPLTVLSAQVTRVAHPFETGEDRHIVLLVLYNGREAVPKIEARDGTSLYDEKGKEIPHSFAEEAVRIPQTQVYSLEAWAKSADFKNVKRLRIEANVSDGKSWPARLKAFADVPTPKK